jgi:hypothetical protein
LLSALLLLRLASLAFVVVASPMDKSPNMLLLRAYKQHPANVTANKEITNTLAGFFGRQLSVAISRKIITASSSASFSSTSSPTSFSEPLDRGKAVNPVTNGDRLSGQVLMELTPAH